MFLSTNWRKFYELHSVALTQTESFHTLGHGELVCADYYQEGLCFILHSLCWKETTKAFYKHWCTFLQCKWVAVFFALPQTLVYFIHWWTLIIFRYPDNQRGSEKHMWKHNFTILMVNKKSCTEKLLVEKKNWRWKKLAINAGNYYVFVRFLMQTIPTNKRKCCKWCRRVANRKRTDLSCAIQINDDLLEIICSYSL